MLFDTIEYWLYFVFVLLLVAALKPRAAKWLLVAASYVFYACWDVRFVFLLGGATLANYLFGLWIDRREGAARRRMVAGAIAFNLIVLGFFKYFNFFADTLIALTGLPQDSVALRILLPVGISFFTFEGIAYTIDVYRRDLRPVRSPLDFALFVAFFPHLVAGPIIRPIAFIPQIGQPLALSDEDSRWGLREILKGLFKKLALANYLAPIADAYFQQTPYAGQPVPAWIGVLAFSLQIYFDFSGYTDIARGCARLLGFRFPSNFERPYLSGNITDFWRRWHVSLSTWLRDYLYVPLGGNRRGTGRTYVNLLIVMGLGGLWHGASWNFAIWGLYHGVLLCAHRLWRQWRRSPRLDIDGARQRLLPASTALTFLLVTLGWVPFRAADLHATVTTLRDLWAIPETSFLHAHPGIGIIAMASLGWCMIDRDRRIQDWLVQRASWPAAVAVGGCMAWGLELLAHVDTQIPFVYFQF